MKPNPIAFPAYANNTSLAWLVNEDVSRYEVTK